MGWPGCQQMLFLPEMIVLPSFLAKAHTFSPLAIASR
jgi:hypothetical protein